MSRLFPSAESLRPRGSFSRWDLVVIPGILVLVFLLTVGLKGVTEPFSPSTPDLAVSLAPEHLPYYGLRSLIRMGAALALSLLFTLTYAPLAAKVPRTEKVLIPLLDFLQSLPILGFLTVTTSIFLGLFRNNVLGLEAVSVFAIFTSQVWNMTFSFYHSLITLPRELNEATVAFRLSGWQRFWKLEVPFAIPSLVWNTMMSVSGGWFFVVASEVISVVGRDHRQFLPGVGSYIAVAIGQANLGAMVYAGLTLLVLVLAYDQLIFRPIVAWAEKFKFEQSEAQEIPHSWVLTALNRARFVSWLKRLPAPLWEWLWLRTAHKDRPGRSQEPSPTDQRGSRTLDWVFNTGVIALGLFLFLVLARFLFGPSLGVQSGHILQPNRNLNTELSHEVARSFAALGVPVGADNTVWLSDVCAVVRQREIPSPGLLALFKMKGVAVPADISQACTLPRAPPGKVSLPEIPEVARLGLFTALRVTIFVLIVALIWTPIGVWIGMRRRVAQIVQPVVQFAAAFPANLLFPLFVVLIAALRLNPEIWTSPLMVLGGQWYILFNVIAGTIAIPNDLWEAARTQALGGWRLWRRLILPGIFPAFVTGGITASGGSWNASIVAEVVSWGGTTLVATGLGAYIARWSTGEFNPHVGLGMLIMGLLVLSYNRLIWRRLYRLAEERFRLD